MGVNDKVPRVYKVKRRFNDQIQITIKLLARRQTRREIHTFSQAKLAVTPTEAIRILLDRDSQLVHRNILRGIVRPAPHTAAASGGSHHSPPPLLFPIILVRPDDAVDAHVCH